MKARRVASLIALAAVTSGGAASGAAPPAAAAVAVPTAPVSRTDALFALILGVNASPAPDVPPLHYADDDAARYLDLFRALGARTYLLSRLDENTRRLHPQAAAEAQPAGKDDLRRAVAALTRDIAQARARGVRSVLYVVYAGHGDSSGGSTSLTLDDGLLDGPALVRDVVTPPHADQSHVIVDACQAYLLAFERGPGGARRQVRGFVELEAASRAGHIGYLLSTSSTGEAHEWAGFEAGVFSHEVRSGLYGAADADGDGVVTYDEIAAFVTRANAGIVADRFRPEIIARAPAGGNVLVDLRPRAERELRFEGPDADAHYLLEDAQGVRLLDFHGAASSSVHLMRPTAAGPLYLRRLADGAERTIPPSDAPIQMDEIPIDAERARTRGAAHRAFSAIFALPFDDQVVTAFETQAREQRRAEAAANDDSPRSSTRRLWGRVALGAGVLAAGAGVGLEVWALDLHARSTTKESQLDLADRDRRITRLNTIAGPLLLGGAVAAVAGSFLIISGRPSPIDVAASPSGVSLATSWRF